MEKIYKIRGKEISVERIDGVQAIKPSVGTRTIFEKIIQDVDPNARKTFELLKESFGKEADSLETFANAGWIFVAPRLNVIETRNFKSRDGLLDSVSNVYKDSNGNLLIDTNRLSIKFQPELEIEAIMKILDDNTLRIVRELKFAKNLFEVEIVTNEDVIDMANEIAHLSEVIYAEPQMVSRIDQRLKPVDPHYDRQWHLNNDGSNGGKAGADVRMELAWNISQGRGVKLAIIDNGFDLEHPDLSPSIYQQSAGYFLYNGIFRNSLIGFPDANHGTFCAGMVFPRIDNLGIVGVANEAEFIPVACYNDQTGTQSTLARSIAYASNPSLEVPRLTQDKGADVIACSLGPNVADWVMESVLEDAINYVVMYGRKGKGTPIFWAVSNGNFTIDGNDGTDEVSAFDNTISVGRSNIDDKEDGSAYGPELDFLAPGSSVYSCQSGGAYGFSTGTSFAAPLAAGVGALLIAKNPSLNWKEVRQAMRNSCDKIGGVNYSSIGHHPRYGYGRINAAGALNIV